MSRLLTKESRNRPAAQAGGVQETFHAAAPGGTVQVLSPSELARSKPGELTWRDYLVMLLHIGAEIEHSLMVQYLFAAYSLGGEHVPARSHSLVRRWRDEILTVAREEMGHLMTVQNLLRLVGGPVSLDREDYPFDTPWNPYPFKLQRLTLDALACYVYAEKPAELPVPGREDRKLLEDIDARVEAIAGAAHAQAHHVDEIYETILLILASPDLIPDAAFRAETYAQQASWEEWGRQYGRPDPLKGSHARDREGVTTARVIIPQMATRTQAVAALREVAGQGEAPHLGPVRRASRTQVPPDLAGEPSHFDRFFRIYAEYDGHVGRNSGWSPTHPVVDNPSTMRPGAERKGVTFIAHERTRAWARLFNLRYRMLLTYLAHWHRLPAQPAGEPGPRTGLLHRTFAEMYNLKTLGGMLVRMPVTENPADPDRAGPPFEMPYSLALPEGDADSWRLHADLLSGSLQMCKAELRRGASDGESRFLAALQDLDRQSLAWISGMLDATAARRPYA